MDHWQYLFVLMACLAITAPLEILGSGVYRRGWRAVSAVIPVAGAFVVWDVIAIAAHIWSYNPQFISGLGLPGVIPIEELLFFVVVPLCGLLTYNAVDTILAWLQRMRARSEPTS